MDDAQRAGLRLQRATSVPILHTSYEQPHNLRREEAQRATTRRQRSELREESAAQGVLVGEAVEVLVPATNQRVADCVPAL